MHKTYLDGTHRTRSPGETWEAIQPLLAAFDIPRVADVTGLDDIGIPVAMAIRPMGRTLSVAQGKGSTLVAARVSAAMEAIEACHGEYAVPRTGLRTSAERLGLPYRVTALEHHPGSLVTKKTIMEWTTGHFVASGAEIPVPVAAIELGRQMHSWWRLHLPASSTNGLASGNTRDEAVSHALYELIERDVLSELIDPLRPVAAQRIDSTSVDDPHCSRLIEHLERARVWFELWSLKNIYGVPVMACYIWREDQQAITVSGSGAHLDPSVALSRAITEAAQTRLTYISGSREDTHPIAYRPGVRSAPAHHDVAPVAWAEITQGHARGFSTHGEEALFLAGLIEAKTGVAPIAVDLVGSWFRDPPFSVVKVLAPCLRYLSHHTVPLPSKAVAA
ncbi:YcaO-like family protein [Streptomyces sp. DSM 41527]|uniref:YcaO-like family protein n=1 Tax=Streptomyces mooreae TaxID=3075523 RepID=A0ABU2TDY4_9ACTN|nr:YcaO-like family protein [Streptomyces sp. DSM 41527]MDT0459156.1 YcaO-like family protein [Streptomyces sp. DSM 41527]